MRPTIFVLYGATGDLARRMVLPAFFGLATRGLLPDDWRLVGNGRGQVSDDAFRKEVRDALDDVKVSYSEEDFSRFAANLCFAGSGFTEDDPGELLDVLRDIRHAFAGAYDLVHYLAVPPTDFLNKTKAIEANGLIRGAKAIYEKPFGTSPESFEELNDAVHEIFDESHVYRIDHFLGKEGTQDLYTARFNNAWLESTWNREHVEAVQIDIPETLGINDRAKFYDSTGAFLDMIVTHLLQLAAEVAMEPPLSNSADDILSARETVIDAFRPFAKEDVVFGQFNGFTDVEGVAHDSQTDTLVAARLWVDTDRWHGVPFLLRTGKMMKRKAERVTLIYRRPPTASHHQPRGAPPYLSFDLAGDGGIDLAMTVKKPGPTTELSSISFGGELSSVDGGSPMAPYERLIHDALVGDRTRFTRPDGLRYAWRTVAPILQDRPTAIAYEPGTWARKRQKNSLRRMDGWQRVRELTSIDCDLAHS